MTNRHRREKYDREPSLRSIARAQPLTGRGFAASKGVRLPRALEVGRTTTGALKRPCFDEICMAESSCDEPRMDGYYWCERHSRRAEMLGVAVPAVPN